MAMQRGVVYIFICKPAALELRKSFVSVLVILGKLCCERGSIFVQQSAHVQSLFADAALALCWRRPPFTPAWSSPMNFHLMT